MSDVNVVIDYLCHQNDECTAGLELALSNILSSRGMKQARHFRDLLSKSPELTKDEMRTIARGLILAL
jgi:hypothetical protein